MWCLPYIVVWGCSEYGLPCLWIGCFEKFVLQYGIKRENGNEFLWYENKRIWAGQEVHIVSFASYGFGKSARGKYYVIYPHSDDSEWG